MTWTSIVEIFIILFAVIDPPGIIPPFLGLMSRISRDQKKSIAARSVLISAIVLISFTFMGDRILDWLKISEAAFYIASGLLLFRSAFNMVLAQPSSGIDRTTREEDKEAASKHEISIFPLAIPLIAGPGSIATVIFLSRKGENSLIQHLMIVLAVIFILALTYVCLRLLSPIARLLGVTGRSYFWHYPCRFVGSVCSEWDLSVFKASCLLNMRGRKRMPDLNMILRNRKKNWKKNVRVCLRSVHKAS